MNRFHKIKTIALIMMIFLVACIETDMYLPSFPDMMIYFNTTEAMIQNILAWNFMGICASGPFYGPLSDSFGRKPVLMVALSFFLIGSIGTVLSNNIELMLLCRVLQGIGSGGCFTLGTAVIFDVFHEEEAIKVVNELNSIVPIIMAMAPMTGGYLNLHYGFRANFLVIAVFVVVSYLVSLFLLKESLPAEKRSPFQINKIINDFITALTCLRFWVPMMMINVIFTGYIAYISYSSILFVNDLGVSRTIFPYYQASVLIAFVSASLSANRFIANYGVACMKRWGLLMMIISGIWFIAAVFWDPSYYNLFHLGMIIYSFGAGWLIGPFFAEGMEVLPDIKGVTASIITSFRLLTAGAGIAAASMFYDGTARPVAILFVVLILLGFIIYTPTYRQERAS